MERLYHPSQRCLLKIWAEDFDDSPLDARWYARVIASVTVTCSNQLTHTINIEMAREITTEEDPPLLNVFEWAVRGSDTAAARLAAMLIDEEMYRSYMDPCSIPAADA